MEDWGLYIPEAERETAVHKYKKEQQKLAKGTAKHMTKSTTAKILTEYIAAGAVLGCVLSLLLAPRLTEKPVRDVNGRVVEYKRDAKATSKTTTRLIALSILGALLVSGMFAAGQRADNKRIAKSMTKDALNKCFEAALQEYNVDSNTAAHIQNAAAYIVNNMSEKELKALRDLIIKGTHNIKYFDNFHIQHDAISAASQIITTFINKNPDAKRDIDSIMNGKEPRTYFLNELRNQIAFHNAARSQKTY